MSNDLISRSAAIKIAMLYCPDDDGSCSKANIDIREMLDDLENLPGVDAEPVRLRIDTVEVDAEKGWYRKLHYCPCGQLIRTETWDKKYCFGQGTVLKGNVMPKHCPNCGAKMDAEVSE